MALERVIKQFFFSQGPDTNVTVEGIEPGKLSILEAAQFNRIGAISHQNGSQAYGDTAYAGEVEMVDSLQSLPIVASKAKYSAAPGTNTTHPSTVLAWNKSLSKWGPGLKAGNALTTEFNYGGLSGSINNYLLMFDSAYYNGLLYLAVTSDLYQNLFCIDPESQTLLLTIHSESSAVGTGICRVIVFNSKIYFFSFESGTNNLRVREYDPATGSLGGSQMVVNNIQRTILAATSYDLWVDTTNSRVYLAYKNSTASTLTINSYSALTSGALATPLPTVNTATIATIVGGCISIAGALSLTTPVILVTFDDAAKLNAISYQRTLALAPFFGPSTLVTVPAGQTIRTITTSPNIYDGSNSIYITYTVANAGTSYPEISITPVTAGAIGTPKTVPGVEVYSKPIKIGNSDYIWLKGNRSLQGAMYLAATRGGNCQGTPLYIMGKVFSGDLDANTAPVLLGAGIPMSIAGPDADGNYFVAAAKVLSEYSQFITTIAGSVVGFNITAKERWKSQLIADSLVFTGGMLQQFDGEAYYENGFLEFPDSGNFIRTPVAGAGSLTPSSTYSIALVWEAVDANGKVSLSAPSVPVAVTMGAADNTINYSFFNNIISLCNKTNYNLLIYRTTASGSIYYLDTKLAGISGVPILSSTLTRSDSDLSQSALLYTQSGELENWTPWGVYDVAVFKDRLFVLTARGIYYSKKVEIGDPVEFSEVLQVAIESAGGPPTAIAAFQDKLLIFKRDRIYYIVGDGPNDTGTYGDFSPPQLMNVAAGCINNRSTITHDNYVYFQTTNSICRLNAKFELERIGDPLNYYFIQQPTILSCTLNSRDRQIRWTDATRTYVFGYEPEQWSIFPTRPAVSSTMLKDEYLFVAGTQLNKEITTAITEYTGSIPTMRVATGWIQFGNMQGFQRVYSAIILGRKINNHTLTVKVMYDYSPVVVETHTINETTSNSYIYTDQILYDGASASANTGADQTSKPYQYKVKLSRQKCQSVRFLLEESNQNSAGTVDLVGIAFELGIKAQTNKQWMGDSRNV